MDYLIYTDGSCEKNKGKAGAAFLIYTKDVYIGYGVRHIETKYIMEAEFGAITDAIRFLLDKLSLTKEDNVKIFSDSLYSCDLCNAILRGEEVLPTYKILARSSGKYLLELFECVNSVRVIKFQAHMKEFNSNKLVDKLAKYAANMV